MGFIRPLVHALRKPPLFDEVDESFWREPYISEQILDAHLDSGSDDASRRSAIISRSSRWISGLIPSGSRLLDLGCGPGLYCEQFHRLGLRVTGMDYSRTAIAYARERAERLGHPIDYRLADYRTIELPSPFEIITLIYGGFCCITDSERDDLLGRVRRALTPDGLFVFDVFTTEYIDRSPGSCYLRRREGFWRPGAHLVIEQRHEYPEADAHLDRYIVIDPRRGTKAYNLWKRYYTRDSLMTVLEAAGFEAVGWYGDLAGASFHPRGPWIGLVARARYPWGTKVSVDGR